MASSAHKQQQQQLPNIYGGATAAPPPTPSTLPNNHLSTSAATADVLSRLLHRLPPTLSLPTRRSPSATCPPVVSLSETKLTDRLLSSSSTLGYFQLIDHDISSQLARSAELESFALFELEKDQKEACFPKNWPLGFEADDEEDGEVNGESFCLDSTCSTESTELSLTCLRELTRAMGEVGLKIIEMLSSAVGFENPLGEDPTRLCSLMWVTQGSHGDNPVLSAGFYPYIVGLQYQIRHQKYSLLTDSGRASILPQVDAILVTLGDIAQVWSNGKLKKVRGRAAACSGDGDNNSYCVSMSLLVTLPTDSRVSPLIPKAAHRTTTSISTDQNGIAEDYNHHHAKEEGGEEEGERLMFDSFDFEDYAWRVYHERLHLKDPLDRYRI